MASLSVCMIVKNEERFLADCLKSVKEIAHQIVIVDTGSEDGTMDIARKFGAEVHSFKWQDDFSAARNESIKYATGDWILWLDADERLLPESLDELKKLIKPEHKALAYMVQIRNRMPDGKNYKFSTAHRLFTNHCGIRFDGRVHEQIAYSVAALGGEERRCNVTLDHLGYALQPTAQNKKNLRNRKLLEKMVREQPQNAYAHFTLAQNYNISGEWAKAVKHYRRAQNLDTLDAALQGTLLNTLSESLFKLSRFAEARDVAVESLDKFPRQAGAYYLMYKIALAQNEPEQALRWLFKLNEQNSYLKHHPRDIATDVLFHEDNLFFEIARLYRRLGNFNESLNWLNRLSEAGQQDKAAAEMKVQLLLKLGRLAETEEVLQKLNHPPQAGYLDLLGLVQMKRQKFTQAIDTYSQLLKLQPDNSSVLRRLAGLYAKTGQTETAKQLLSLGFAATK